MHFIYGHNTMWLIIFMAIVWLGLIIIGVLLIRNFIKEAPKSENVSKEKYTKSETDKEGFKRSKIISKKG